MDHCLQSAGMMEMPEGQWSVESQGFRKLVVERDNQPCIVDNPRWRSGE